MSKQKQQSWDWKNPVDQETAENRARMGGLSPGAWAVAFALSTCSDEYRTASRKDPTYQMAIGDVMVKKWGFESKAAFEADVDKRSAKKLANVSRVLCSAAYAGNSRAFRALAECVEFIRTNGIADQWADPLAQLINDHVFSRWLDSLKDDPTTRHEDFMRISHRFNIEEFIEATGTSADRATIAKRVRALGYSTNKGRPRGTKNKER